MSVESSIIRGREVAAHRSSLHHATHDIAITLHRLLNRRAPLLSLVEEHDKAGAAGRAAHIVQETELLLAVQ